MAKSGLDALKKAAAEQLEEMLDQSASSGELTAEAANRAHSDIADNIWDMYVGGSIEMEIEQLGHEQGTSRYDKLYESVHDHYLACFDKSMARRFPPAGTSAPKAKAAKSKSKSKSKPKSKPKPKSKSRPKSKAKPKKSKKSKRS
jgi:hypothetical protein